MHAGMGIGIGFRHRILWPPLPASGHAGRGPGPIGAALGRRQELLAAGGLLQLLPDSGAADCRPGSGEPSSGEKAAAPALVLRVALAALSYPQTSDCRPLPSRSRAARMAPPASAMTVVQAVKAKLGVGSAVSYPEARTKLVCEHFAGAQGSETFLDRLQKELAKHGIKPKECIGAPASSRCSRRRRPCGTCPCPISPRAAWGCPQRRGRAHRAWGALMRPPVP